MVPRMAALLVALLWYLHAAYCYGAAASWAGRSFRRLSWLRQEAVAGRVGETLAVVSAVAVYALVS